MLQVKDFIVPTDFHIFEAKKDVYNPLILGSTFLKNVGAIMDSFNKRISFSKINKKIFYHMVPVKEITCSIVTEGEKFSLQLRGGVKKYHEIPKVKPCATLPGEKKKKKKHQGKQLKTMQLFPRVVSWEKTRSFASRRGKHTLKRSTSSLITCSSQANDKKKIFWWEATDF